MNATAAAITPNAEVLSRTFAALNVAPIDLDQLRQQIPVVRHRLEAGEYLYRSGQPFRAIYLIHAGSVKTCELSEDGREQVTGFRMRGELVGVESIGLATHVCDVIALETSEIWELPYPPVLTACLRIPDLQMRLTSALAAEIRRDRSWMLAIGTLTAEQRVAAFLLDIAARYEAMGFSGFHFVLRMSRADMASYLAIKHETVSRALAQLSDANCISVQRREIRILDRQGMNEIAGVSASVH
jgi:CRP/FNR family transcriptional regulator